MCLPARPAMHSQNDTFEVELHLHHSAASTARKEADACFFTLHHECVSCAILEALPEARMLTHLQTLAWLIASL